MKKPIDIHVTRDGYAKLEEEFKYLTERRPGVLTRMVAAREMGDLSENAGYHAAKEELGKIDGRLRELKLILRFAEVIESKGEAVVDFGCKVKVKVDDMEVDFTIVSALEADPAKGKLSDASPIGRALLGKKVGDDVQIEVPDGKVVYKIIEVASN